MKAMWVMPQPGRTMNRVETLESELPSSSLLFEVSFTSIEGIHRRVRLVGRREMFLESRFDGVNSGLCA